MKTFPHPTNVGSITPRTPQRIPHRGSRGGFTPTSLHTNPTTGTQCGVCGLPDDAPTLPTHIYRCVGMWGIGSHGFGVPGDGGGSKVICACPLTAAGHLL